MAKRAGALGRLRLVALLVFLVFVPRTALAQPCSFSSSCSPCRTCQSNNCEPCGDGAICNESAMELCPLNDCGDYASGFDPQLATCYRYTGQGGCCFAGNCYSMFETQFGCSVQGSCYLNPTSPLITCPAGCGIPDSCLPGQFPQPPFCVVDGVATSADCPGPECSSVIYGPSGANCHAYADAPKGWCESTTCRTSTSDCAILANIGSALVSCGSTACTISSACVPGAAITSVTSATFCRSDWSQGGCSPGQGCGPGSTCQSKKSNGISCSIGAECLSGNCVEGYCCSTASCPTCQDCRTGSCTAVPDGPNGGCLGVNCANFVGGWAANTCSRYNGILGGYCLGGTCDTGSSRCSTRDATNRPSCGSSECQKACPVGAALASYDEVSEICHQSGQQSCSTSQTCNTFGTCVTVLLANGNPCTIGTQCQSGLCSNSGHCCSSACTGVCETCSSGNCQNRPNGANGNCPIVTCSNFVATWSGLICATYSGSAGGYCLSGACDTSSARCLGLITSGRPSCLSAGCQKSCVPGAAAAAFDTVSEICYTSLQNSCPVGQVCDSNGACLLVNGQGCSSGSQCLSGICSNSGHCCSSTCSSPCQTCSSGTCANRPDGANGGCGSVDCSLVVHGWSGLTCATYSGVLGGLCSLGSCNTSPTRCASQPVSIVGRPSCGSSGCQRAGVCTQFSASSSSSTVASICFQSGVNGCGSGFFCETSGTCVSTLLSNGQSCVDGTQCSSGICSLSGHCCSSACNTACTTCASGTCQTAPDGPFASCPITDCELYVSGWNGTTCAAYTGIVPGACSSGACVTPSHTLCRTTTTSGRPSCGSAGCLFSCPPGASVSSFSTVSQVCSTSGQASCGINFACDTTGTCLSTLSPNGRNCSSGAECQSGFCSSSGHCCDTPCNGTCEMCPSGACESRPNGPFSNCTAPACSNLLFGWAPTGECALYQSGGVGQCLGGLCDSGTSQCTGLVVAGRPSCVDSGCRKSCPQGALGSDFTAIEDVCYQFGQQGCGAGLQCDIRGACVSGGLPLGNPCSAGTQCASGICSTSGHCCSTACPGRCQDCTNGTCITLPDGPSPSLCPAVNCTRIVGGFNGTVCGTYANDLVGVCSAGNCNTSVVRCAVESYLTDSLTFGTQCQEAACISDSSCLIGSPAPASRASVCSFRLNGGCISGRGCDRTGLCVERTCLDNPQSCCNTPQPVPSSTCETSSGKWVVSQNLTISTTQTVELNCSSLVINGSLQISGTLKSCFLQSTTIAGTIQVTGCAELSGKIELQVFDTPNNGQKQYVVETPCGTITSQGSVVPIPVVPNCNRVGGSAGQDGNGIFVLFSVDAAGCATPGADAIQNLPVAAIGGSIGAAVVLVAIIIIAVVYFKNKRFKEFRQNVRRKLSTANREDRLATTTSRESKAATQEPTPPANSVPMVALQSPRTYFESQDLDDAPTPFIPPPASPPSQPAWDHSAGYLGRQGYDSQQYEQHAYGNYGDQPPTEHDWTQQQQQDNVGDEPISYDGYQ